MTHRVVLSFDNDVVATVSGLPGSVGTREDCLNFIAQHNPPAGYEFEIQDMSTGRLVGYAVRQVPNRVSLLVQDLSHNL